MSPENISLVVGRWIWNNPVISDASGLSTDDI